MRQRGRERGKERSTRVYRCLVTCCTTIQSTSFCRIFRDAAARAFPVRRCIDYCHLARPAILAGTRARDRSPIAQYTQYVPFPLPRAANKLALFTDSHNSVRAREIPGIWVTHNRKPRYMVELSVSWLLRCTVKREDRKMLRKRVIAYPIIRNLAKYSNREKRAAEW